MTGHILVCIGAGEMALSEPFRLDHRDGGTNGYRVFYQGVRSMETVLSGGRKIEGTWEQVAGSVPDLWRIRLPGSAAFRQLYAGGSRQVRARSVLPGQWHRLDTWYNPLASAMIDGQPSGPVDRLPGVASAHDAGILVQWDNMGPCDITALSSVGDVEFVLHHDWVVTRIGVEAILSADDRRLLIAFHPLQGKWLMERDWPPKRTNQPFYLENALEFLDEPGEWFFDKTSEHLYYRPLSGQAPEAAGLVMPQGPATLLEIVGSSFIRQVQAMTVRNIRFEYTNWARPNDDGFLDGQANNFQDIHGGVNVHGHPPPALRIETSRDLVIEDCHFQHLAGSAIEVGTLGSEITIRGNRIQDASGIGVVAGTILHPSQVSRIRIEDNFLSRIGAEYAGAPAIFVPYATGVTIEHNEIAHVPYTGISVGWGWTYEPSVYQDNLIRANHIHHVMEMLGDGGGIYILSRADGCVIEENYIHDIVRSPWTRV